MSSGVLNCWTFIVFVEKKNLMKLKEISLQPNDSSSKEFD